MKIVTTLEVGMHMNGDNTCLVLQLHITYKNHKIHSHQNKERWKTFNSPKKKPV